VNVSLLEANGDVERAVREAEKSTNLIRAGPRHDPIIHLIVTTGRRQLAQTQVPPIVAALLGKRVNDVFHYAVLILALKPLRLTNGGDVLLVDHGDVEGGTVAQYALALVARRHKPFVLRAREVDARTLEKDVSASLDETLKHLVVRDEQR